MKLNRKSHRAFSTSANLSRVFAMALLLLISASCTDRYRLVTENELSADISVEGGDEKEATVAEAKTDEIKPEMNLDTPSEGLGEINPPPQFLTPMDSGVISQNDAAADSQNQLTAEVEVQALDSAGNPEVAQAPVAEKKPEHHRDPASVKKSSEPKKSEPKKEVAKTDAPKPEEAKREPAAEKNDKPMITEPFPHFYKLALVLGVIGLFARASGVQRKRRQEELARLMNGLEDDS